MSAHPIKNLAASVRQRLFNLAKATGRPCNEVVQHYAQERWLYRLSRSEQAELFLLKGALLLAAWQLPVTRPTRDIDLLARADNDLGAMRQMIRAICQTAVEEDGMLFDAATVTTEPIAEDADYQGVRATFVGLLGTIRCPMQIDMGFSDTVTPAPVSLDYPTILNFPAPRLRAYNRETAIAEKFEAMVKLGELNSRMKDFFDIWSLSGSGTFDGPTLASAVATTFNRRGTPMDVAAACFTESYANDESKTTQWRAFVKRNNLKGCPFSFPEAWRATMVFLRPVAEAIQQKMPFSMAWPIAGPWHPKE